MDPRPKGKGTKEKPYQLPAELAREPRWRNSWDRRPPGAARKAAEQGSRGKPLLERLGERLGKNLAERGGL